MESSKSEEEEKEMKDKTKEKKSKIIKNKYKYYLLNVISDFIYNKNNFEEKIKPNELEINLLLDSNKSTYNKTKYDIKLNYDSFNPKRDLIKNIKLYKSFPNNLQIKDEYYQDDFGDILVNLYPKIRKGINLDFSEFPLYSYHDKKINKNIKDEIKKDLECQENEFVLCIYLSIFEENNTEIIQMVENVVETPLYDKCFKSTYIIIQVKE